MRTQNRHEMMMLAFIIIISSLVSLIEGVCDQILSGFDVTLTSFESRVFIEN